MEATQPTAVEHVPPFITAPGQTDVLFVVTVVLLIAIVLLIGNLYFRLHALPEHVAHRTNRVQMEIVAVLALLALFTHNHLYWIAALLLAFVHLPDFSTPINSMSQSLEKLARGVGLRREEELKATPETKRLPEELERLAHGNGLGEEQPQVVAKKRNPSAKSGKREAER
jgi:hypothetical protein